ncbi:Zinc finger protein 358 [Eumeta japonica]|uniref:Zinc finger protein 358 n=1 Tax=Eumeta variegata TaxID=151549 RepID=A0A4C1ZTQ1_EUMVA|nr:Zinc finger protein 358 [Eumeta japonica]
MEICISCMGTENLLNIFDNYVVENNEENYVDMFRRCFDIEISQDDNLEMICSHCIEKLRDAFYFKQQTLNTKDILLSTKDMKLEADKLNVEYLDDSIWDNIDVIDNRETTNEDVRDDGVTINADEFLTEIKRETNDFDLDDEENKYSITVEKPLGICFSVDKSIMKKYSRGKKKRPYKPETRPYTIHPNQKTCHLCQEEFLHHRLLIMHMNSHFPNHICEICGKKFATKMLLKRHLRSHEPGPFNCKFCNMEYRNRNTLMTHIRFKHRALDPYICPECKERFKSFHQKLSHLKTVHGQTEKKYQCNYCSDRFYYAGQRSKHIKQKHLKLKPYKCTECPMVFGKRLQLENHLAHAHKIGEKKYQCHLCFKKYCSKRSLIEHLRIHANDRKSVNLLFVLICLYMSTSPNGDDEISIMGTVQESHIVVNLGTVSYICSTRKLANSCEVPHPHGTTREVTASAVTLHRISSGGALPPPEFLLLLNRPATHGDYSGVITDLGQR